MSLQPINPRTSSEAAPIAYPIRWGSWLWENLAISSAGGNSTLYKFLGLAVIGGLFVLAYKAYKSRSVDPGSSPPSTLTSTSQVSKPSPDSSSLPAATPPSSPSCETTPSTPTSASQISKTPPIETSPDLSSPLTTMPLSIEITPSPSAVPLQAPPLEASSTVKTSEGFKIDWSQLPQRQWTEKILKAIRTIIPKTGDRRKRDFGYDYLMKLIGDVSTHNLVLDFLVQQKVMISYVVEVHQGCHLTLSEEYFQSLEVPPTAETFPIDWDQLSQKKWVEDILSKLRAFGKATPKIKVSNRTLVDCCPKHSTMVQPILKFLLEQKVITSFCPDGSRSWIIVLSEDFLKNL